MSYEPDWPYSWLVANTIFWLPINFVIGTTVLRRVHSALVKNFCDRIRLYWNVSTIYRMFRVVLSPIVIFPHKHCVPPPIPLLSYCIPQESGLMRPAKTWQSHVSNSLYWKGVFRQKGGVLTGRGDVPTSTLNTYFYTGASIPIEHCLMINYFINKN